MTPSLWGPVLIWTALALVAEAALRAASPTPSVGLWVRGGLLAALPAALVASPLFSPWVPSLVPSRAMPAPVHAAASPQSAPSGLAVPALPDGVVSVADVVVGSAVAVAGLLALGALLLLGGGLVWLGRYRRSLRDAGGDVQADARAIARRIGLRRPVRVAAAAPASGPYTMGWRRPLVAVPAGLGGESLQFTLAHELAHVRDGHFGWHLAERVVRAVFVWHPAVHVLGRGLALDRERAADATVLRLWPGRAEAYGRLLLAFASTPSPALALGAASPPLLHRLAAMTRRPPDRPRLARLAGLAVFVLPLVFAAAAVPDAAPEHAPQPPAALLPAPLAPRDTLPQHVRRVVARTVDGVRSVTVELVPGTSAATATRLADWYAEGGEAGMLTVVGDGIRIERSTLRADAFPPPPPPPPPPPAHAALPAPPEPAAPPAPPPAPPAAPAAPPAPSAPPPAEAPRSPAPPPPPPTSSAYRSAWTSTVRYAGVDLTRLTPDSRRAFEQALAALPDRLAREGVSFGEVHVEYLIDPDGTTRRFRVTAGPRDLHQAAVDLARGLRFAEAARPGAPAGGFFRLEYRAG